jgi:hypothetical protein
MTAAPLPPRYLVTKLTEQLPTTDATAAAFPLDGHPVARIRRHTITGPVGTVAPAARAQTAHSRRP